MLSFENDYNVGAHPKLLQRLAETNLEPQTGYGLDDFCAAAKERIKLACACPNAEIFFLTGGTQTNQVVIDACLQRYEGVVAAQTAHIAQHEAGAIEFSGHKVLELPSHDGKLCASELKAMMERFYGDDSHEHMVFPGMVYLSFPTELGTLYSKTELTELNEVCRAYALPIFIDGARLGYGLMSKQCDLTLPELAGLCDVFYIGGTKVGALCGEAVVFPRGGMPKYFLTRVKQHGALLAKGRVLGVQFDALFTDGLYFEISKNAIDRAEEMKAIFREKGCRVWKETPTNQQFLIVKDSELERLSKLVAYSFWEKYDEDHTVIRLVTSWATTKEQVQQLRAIL
ncbi:MAG: low specificity L-threonine aldolase [Oscillospiraceae bacterium]|nr:low specificity L-threonine aldolase [Oscillospiraceae bacterium]